MKNNIKCLLFILLILAVNVAKASENQAPLYLLRGVRPMSLGNAFEAIADDINALHYNPAGIAQTKETLFGLLLIRARVSFDLFDELKTATELFEETIDPIINSDEPLTDPSLTEEREELVDQLEEMMVKTLSAMPDIPTISLIIPHRISDKMNLAFGGSIYSQGAISTYIERRGVSWGDPIIDMLDNALIYDVAWQLNLEIATAFEISIDKPFLKTAYVGFDYKKIRRELFSDADDPFTVADVLNPNGEDGIEGTDDDFSKRYFDFEGKDPLEFAQDNFESQKGYTTDLGFLVTPLDGLKLALTIRNLSSNLSPEDGEDKSFPRNIVYSASVKPFVLADYMEFLEKPSWFDLTLAASIDKSNGDDLLRDFAETVYTENALKHDNIHLGTEFVIWPDKPISLSFWAGNNQGYATFGTRLKLAALYFNFAKYGDLKANWYVGSVEMAF